MASAYIDLTSSTLEQVRRPGYAPRLSNNSFNSPESRSPSRLSLEPRGIKRRRFSDDSLRSSTPSSLNAHRSGAIDLNSVEAVDLTEVNDDSALSKALAKQRQDAIQAQADLEDREGRSTLTATKCAICMDTPTDATTTSCGHLFCHKCIVDALRYDEEQRTESTNGKPTRGKCPACRKLLSRKDTPGQKRDLIPLQFKLVTKKRPS